MEPTPSPTAISTVFDSTILFLANEVHPTGVSFLWIVSPPDGEFWTFHPDQENATIESPSWSPDKRWIAYVLAKPDSFDVRLLDTETRTSHTLLTGLVRTGEGNQATYLRIFGWSSDSKWLAFSHPLTETNTTYLLQVFDGTLLEVIPPAPNLYGFTWTHDASGRFAYWRWVDGVDLHLFIGSLAETSAYVRADTPATVRYFESLQWHPNEDKILAVTARRTDLSDQLWAFDVTAQEWYLLMDIPVEFGCWSPDGTRLAVFAEETLSLFDAESLDMLREIRVEEKVFGMSWANEDTVALCGAENVLIVPIDGTQPMYWAIDPHGELYDKMKYVAYIEW